MTYLKKYNTFLSGWLGLVVWWVLLYVIIRKILSLNMTKNKIVYEIEGLLSLYHFHPDTSKIILAQFAHETGNFTSKVFKENNNLSGMKQAKIRVTTALGTKNNHAYYANLADSVKDFRLYYNYNKIPEVFNEPMAIDTYISTLNKKNYFEDKEENYLKGVKKFYSLYYGK